MTTAIDWSRVRDAHTNKTGAVGNGAAHRVRARRLAGAAGIMDPDPRPDVGGLGPGDEETHAKLAARPAAHTPPQRRAEAPVRGPGRTTSPRHSTPAYLLSPPRTDQPGTPRALPHRPSAAGPEPPSAGEHDAAALTQLFQLYQAQRWTAVVACGPRVRGECTRAARRRRARAYARGRRDHARPVRCSGVRRHKAGGPPCGIPEWNLRYSLTHSLSPPPPPLPHFLPPRQVIPIAEAKEWKEAAIANAVYSTLGNAHQVAFTSCLVRTSSCLHAERV